MLQPELTRYTLRYMERSAFLAHPSRRGAYSLGLWPAAAGSALAQVAPALGGSAATISLSSWHRG